MPTKKISKTVINKRATSRVSATPTKQQTSKAQSKSSVPKKAQSAALPKSNQKNPNANKHVGEIWCGETKYIDTEPKKQRNYVVVVDDGKHQTVSKLKSIKIFDEKGKNADKALVEINATRYGLEKRTGVESETFSTNRMSGRPLTVSNKRVFPDEKPRAKLGSRDTSRVLRHTGRMPKQKKRKK